MNQETKPAGVIILALLNFAYSAIALAMIFLPRVRAVYMSGSTWMSIVLCLAIGVGLWSFQEWGRWLAIFGYGIFILVSLFSFVEDPSLLNCIWAVVLIGIIIYLFLPAVSDHFD